MGWDPSTRLFAQDVELGQRAASWEGYSEEEAIRMLPSLWRYTLLRCSLASHADRYPDGTFRLFVILGREQEAIGLAELLTNEKRKANALSEIALQLREQGTPQADWIGLLRRAEQVSLGIQNRFWQARALCELVQALAQAQQWQQAEAVISHIENSFQQALALCELGKALAQVGESERAAQVWHQAEVVISHIEYSEPQALALRELGQALAQAQQWQQAEAVIYRIKDSNEQTRASRTLGQALVHSGRDRILLRLIRHFWLIARTRDEVLTHFNLATHFIRQYPELGMAFFEGFTWVDAFLAGEKGDTTATTAD